MKLRVNQQFFLNLLKTRKPNQFEEKQSKKTLKITFSGSMSLIIIIRETKASFLDNCHLL